MSSSARVPTFGCTGRLALASVILAAGCLLSMGAKPGARDESAQSMEEGKKLFHARCGYCHLPGGTGTIMLARRLGKDRSLLEERSDLNVEYIKKVTRVGINGMPPHNRIELPESELDLIAAYLTRPASARTSAPAAEKAVTP